MKKNFNLDELEMFLSESADQHRIYPSDRVWRNIDKELHGNKRWPALTFGAILTGAVITAGLFLFYPNKNLFDVSVNVQAVSPASSQGIQKNSDLAQENGQSFKKISQPYSKSSKGSQPNLAYLRNSGSGDNGNEEIKGLADIDLISPDYKVIIVGSSNSTQAPSTLLIAPAEKIETIAPPENLIAEESATDLKAKITIASTQETASPQVTKSKKISRWAIEFYATPSVSYRSLDEEKIVDMHLPANGPLAPNYTNGVNKFVRHTPKLGLEAGSAVIYKVTPDLSVKTGVQFNYREYGIDAYASSTQSSTVFLNRGASIDSLTGFSAISNQGGYRPIEITNKYFQIAIPVGFDLRLAGKKKLELYVSGSIQPTYQFNSSIYILSGDYKNYVQEPGLIRQWNINSAIETFVSYKAAGLTWKAGPQIRYQMLPGTISQYPIREHLIDYGLKIGVVKTLK